MKIEDIEETLDDVAQFIEELHVDWLELSSDAEDRLRELIKKECQNHERK